MDTSKRLYRSSTSKMVAGVAGGLAEYFDIDPVIIRLVFIILAVAGGGSGIPIYIILWIALPLRPLAPYNFSSFYTGTPGATETNSNTSSDTPGNTSDPAGEGNKPPTEGQNTGWQTVPPPPPFAMNKVNKENTNLIIGAALILFGTLFFVGRYIHYINFHNLWPLALVAAGAVLIYSNIKENKKSNP
jgi:phage shock protein C